MLRNLIELSEEINGRKHCYMCPQESPCEEVIAYCKAIIKYCEDRLEEAKAAEEKAPVEDVQSIPVLDLEKEMLGDKPADEEVKDVGCCSI